jgi:hypothetical protein
VGVGSFVRAGDDMIDRILEGIGALCVICPMLLLAGLAFTMVFDAIFAGQDTPIDDPAIVGRIDAGTSERRRLAMALPPARLGEVEW